MAKGKEALLFGRMGQRRALVEMFSELSTTDDHNTLRDLRQVALLWGTPVVEAYGLVGADAVVFDQPSLVWAEQVAVDIIATFSDPLFGWSQGHRAGRLQVRLLASDRDDDTTKGVIISGDDHLMLFTRDDYPFVLRLSSGHTAGLRADVQSVLTAFYTDL